MLGDNLLVAPVFHETTAEFYVPAGTWTSVMTGKKYTGGTWYTEDFGFDEMPLLARPNSVIAVGAHTDKPDYNWHEGVTLKAYEIEDGAQIRVEIPNHLNTAELAAAFTVTRTGNTVTATREFGSGEFGLVVSSGGAQEIVSDRAAGEQSVSVEVA